MLGPYEVCSRALNHVSLYHSRLNLNIPYMAAVVSRSSGDFCPTLEARIRMGLWSRKDGTTSPKSFSNIHGGSTQRRFQEPSTTSQCATPTSPSTFNVWLQEFAEDPEVISALGWGARMGVWRRKDSITPPHSCSHIHVGSI